MKRKKTNQNFFLFVYRIIKKKKGNNKKIKIKKKKINLKNFSLNFN
jgi:hypothetical protein